MIVISSPKNQAARFADYADHRDYRRLFLRNYAIDMHIGVHAFEKEAKQRIVINVDLFIPLACSTPAADTLDEVIDYNLMRDTIASIAARARIHLLETFCDEAAQRLLAHPYVRAVRVRAEKPDIYPDCDAVGIEVFHSKEISNGCA